MPKENLERKCILYNNCSLRKEFGNLTMEMNMCDKNGMISSNYAGKFIHPICSYLELYKMKDDGK